MLQAPPNLTRGLRLDTRGESLKPARLGNRLRRLSDAKICGRSTTSSPNRPADYLDRWFEGDLVKALFGFDAIVGNYASPYTPGTAYVLLHHAFGEVNGKRGSGVTRSAAWARSRRPWPRRRRAWRRDRDRRAGARSPDRERPRRRRGAADGRVIRGEAVAANVNPKLLYTSMVPSGALARGLSPPHAALALRLRHVPDERRALRAAELHRPARSAPADHHTAGIIMAPSLGYMDRAYQRRPPTTAGAASRSSSWSSLRRSTTRWRRAGRMWRACSASTWRRSCPTAGRGTDIARTPSPT